MDQAATKAIHTLQPTQSARTAGSSTSSSSTFVTSCPAGKLDPVGLPPVAKVFVRPASSSRRPKKPSALDKHLRHVVLLQRYNRHKSSQAAAAAQHKQAQHQRFADSGNRLRAAILRDGASAGDPCLSTESEPHDPVDPQQSNNSSSAQQTDGFLQAWKPITAAARIKQLQDSLARQQEQVLASLPAVLDPDTLRPDHHKATQQQQQQQCTKASHDSTVKSTASPAEAAPAPAGTAPPHEQGKLDVDAFLDSLLHTAQAMQDTDTPKAAAPTSNATRAIVSSNGKTSSGSNTPAPHLHKPQQQQKLISKGRSAPAWVLSEEQQAAAEAAAAEAEEQQLLQFAEQQEWQHLLQGLGDDELAAAFQELELAEAAAAEGAPDAGQRWQHCFVTALNAAAMKGISDTNMAAAAATAVAAAPGSQQGDKDSCATSASAMRKAEAAAARRQLIHRLHRLSASAGTAAALSSQIGATAPSVSGSSLPQGSVKAASGGQHCSSMMAGAAGAVCCTALGGSGSGGDGWDSSTVYGSCEHDVGRLKTAIKHLEAGEVLIENPDMKAVHSQHSIRSMLSKLEAVP